MLNFSSFLKAGLYNDLCLAFTGSKDDDTMYAVVDKCDFSPPFLWYDWDSNCEDVDLKDHYDATNGSRPLRNEFSRRYLSVYENEDYLHHRPWSSVVGFLFERWPPERLRYLQLLQGRS